MVPPRRGGGPSSSAAAAASLDGLRLTPAPLVPEVQLFLAEDSVVLWARLEAVVGHALPPPFWASTWLGGQALARHVLDHPTTVVGRRVLDLASGSGLVAIAAALAGATVVTANDVDPYAVAAIRVNARANGVDLVVSASDLLADDLLADDPAGDIEVVLAGDAFYHPSVAASMMRFLARIAGRGTRVLVGDPDRGHLPHDWLEPVATYHVPVSGAPEDTLLTRAHVFEVRRDPRGAAREPAGKPATREHPGAPP